MGISGHIEIQDLTPVVVSLHCGERCSNICSVTMKSGTIRARKIAILFPFPTEARRDMGAVRCRERLGGLLKYYEREAA